MILAVDIGNTHIKIGAWDDDNLVFVSRLHTDLRRTTDEYAVDLLNIFRLNQCNKAQFDGAIISSVVPSLSLPIRDCVVAVIKSRRVYLLSPGLKTGLNIRIDNPAQLGSDMVCAAVAVQHKYPMPCIGISLGTATAIFGMDADGNYLGGSLCAGVVLSLEALTMRTAQLPNISLEAPGPVIGTNTVDSMKSGLIYGTADMLDGMVVRMKEVLGDESTVVAFGGLADVIVPYCRQNIIVDEQLVLEGMRLIYRKNAK